ncbi:hypothetical protein SKAU_G00309420 [Synaphobranchus kaupii]|uniref:Uncharacterized protein n=1 Tax=Synaphobranchus kaupii TaxID=118154 RepID=A0A9Q1ERC9_SYNKA|nr:hypothetical protein SKAU_G00309420 [Synaphobranchus kaupii]
MENDRLIMGNEGLFSFLLYIELWATLGYFGLLWATLGYFGLLWATLGYFGLLWATLGYFGLLWAPGTNPCLKFC